MCADYFDVPKSFEEKLKNRPNGLDPDSWLYLCTYWSTPEYQAALPQGIVPFLFAKEYNLHPTILSTSIFCGMLIAIPITLVYYFLLRVV